MEQTIWKKYSSLGFSLIAVSTGIDTGFAHSVFLKSHASFPLVFDLENAALDRYSQADGTIPPMPLGVLIDKTGAVRQIDHTTPADLVELDGAIAKLLAN